MWMFSNWVINCLQHCYALFGLYLLQLSKFIKQYVDKLWYNWEQKHYKRSSLLQILTKHFCFIKNIIKCSCKHTINFLLQIENGTLLKYQRLLITCKMNVIIFPQKWFKTWSRKDIITAEHGTAAQKHSLFILHWWKTCAHHQRQTHEGSRRCGVKESST